MLLVVRIGLDLSPGADAVLAWLSTNLHNLARHPVGSLLGSAFVINGPLLPGASSSFGGTLITLVLGVGVALWWFEKEVGTLPAAGVLAAGHVGATLLTVPVIVWAIGTGRYPADTATALDVGISYGAQAALAAVTALLPRLARIPWVIFVIVWPLTDADWYGLLPDFGTVGHLLSAAIGGTLGALAVRRHRRRPRPDERAVRTL